MPTKINGNQEHSGIGLIILLTMLVAVVIFYMVLFRTLPSIFGGASGDYLLIAAFLALFLAVGFVALVDPLLKRVWPSGYAVVLNDSAIACERPKADGSAINLNQDHTSLFWMFKMTGYPRFGRERQIRKGDFCLGVEIQQDDERMVIYAYVSPTKIGRTVQTTGFTEINMEKIYDTSIGSRVRNWRMPGKRPEIPASLIVSDEGKYWLAERHRWEEGIELTPKDFQAFVEHVRQFHS